jgi:hypothetical protein
MIERGYDQGVPMGSDLPDAPEGRAPKFVVMALKDPEGANLDRVQVVKGWIDAGGTGHDKVYDVAWSGVRTLNADGALPTVGNSVDLATATYSNSIGAAQLAATWTDPEFDPEQGAFYYVRVLEIPTPRWTTYDAVRAGLPLLDGVPSTVQERAWASPIWYTP